MRPFFGGRRRAECIVGTVLLTTALSACGTMNLAELTAGPKANDTAPTCTPGGASALAADTEHAGPAKFRTLAGGAASPATALLVPLLLRDFAAAPEAGADSPSLDAIEKSATTQATKAALTVAPSAAASLPRLQDESNDSYASAQSALMAEAKAEAANLASSMSVRAVSERLTLADTQVPAALRTDKAYMALKSAILNATQTGQQDAAGRALLPPTFLSSTPAPEPPSLSERDFKSFALIVRTALSVEPLAFGGEVPGAAGHKVTSKSSSQMSFRDAFVGYFSAYYKGKYVDRLGNSLQKPVISRTINNTEIAGAVQVMFELLYDYGLRTPVWQDAKKNYYPGGGTTKPTVVELGLVTPTSMLDETDSMKCGITPLKADAIEYLANKAGEKASALGGLVGGSFGGFHFGFGILGKVSIGDNQTLGSIVSTALSRTGERAGEELSWRTLYWVGYNQNSTLADLVQQYLTNNKTKQ
jgi:hypothetical protein